jgi:DNA-binding MarR family transcriptional regulator
MVENDSTQRPIAGDPPGDPADTTDCLVRLVRLAYAEPSGPGLTATQWMVLRYFARANRFSRTVSAFAEYHASTRGTASQTIKGLVQRGYLTRTRSNIDGRSVRLDLTERGRAALTADPCARLDAIVRALPAEQLERLASGVQSLARALATSLRRPDFGRCGRCRYFTDQSSDAGRPVAVCSQLGAEITAEDLAASLCIGHSAA